MIIQQVWPSCLPVVGDVGDGGGVAVGPQSVQVVLLTAILHIIVNRPVQMSKGNKEL